MAGCLIFVWFDLISPGLGMRAAPCLFYCGFGLLSRPFPSNCKALGCVSVYLSALCQTPAGHTVGLTEIGRRRHLTMWPQVLGHESLVTSSGSLGSAFHCNTWEYVWISRDNSKVTLSGSKHDGCFSSTHMISQVFPVETYL